MNLLLIHQAFVSPQEAGGTRHYEFATHALRHGHPFTIIASDLSYLTGKAAVERSGLVTEQTIQGVRVLRSYTYPALHRSFVWRVISFFSFMFSSVWAGWQAGKVDLVIGTTPPIFQAVSAWLIATLRRRPFLLEIRDLWPAFAIDMGILRNPLLIWASRWLESFLYAQATHLLVNSPAYRDYLIEKGVPAKKVSLIANGVDPDMFDPMLRGEQIREKYGLQECFVVTYAGALGIANTIPTILQSAQLLLEAKDIHFLIVGDGKERTHLEEMAQKLGLHNVTFTGAVPKTQMRDMLAASDACVATLQNIPMFSTTYPNKVFDYMAAGRPTILAIDGVIREVIEACNGGVAVPPEDATALAQAVMKLAKDPQLVKQMGAQARQHVEKHFNRQQQALTFVQLVERLGRKNLKTNLRTAEVQ